MKSIKLLVAMTIASSMGSALAMGAFGAAAAGAGSSAPAAKTIVLVHGAFADGSSWDRVIPKLQAKGLKVVAVQNPLKSLADDIAFTKRAIRNVDGPVVLVGHSWAGMVITEAGADDKVKSLVYVAAFAPDEGQAITDISKDSPPSAGLANLVADADGYLSMTPSELAKHFAQDLPAGQTRLMAATQGPVNSKVFGEKVSIAAWKTKPSWFIVATKDHMIQPELQFAMARHIGAHTTALTTSHVAMISNAEAVVAAILQAAK